MPACPLLTLRRPPHEGPTHNSGSWLIAIHYHMEDLHLLLFAGFYRRFRGVPLVSHRETQDRRGVPLVSLGFPKGASKMANFLRFRNQHYYLRIPIRPPQYYPASSGQVIAPCQAPTTPFSTSRN
jgi:hypothetical protein